MPKRPDETTFVAPRYVAGSFGYAPWPNPETGPEFGYAYDNNLNANQPGWPGQDVLLNYVSPDHIDDHFFGGWTARDVGTFDHASSSINFFSDASTDSSLVSDLTGTPTLLIRGTFHRWAGADPEYRKLLIYTDDGFIDVEPTDDDFELTLPLTLLQGRKLAGLEGYYAWDLRVGDSSFNPPETPGFYGVAIWKCGVVGDFTFGTGGGGTGGGGTTGPAIPVVHGASTAPSRAVHRVRAGHSAMDYPIVLDLDSEDGTTLDDGDGTVSAFVQGAAPLQDVTFTLGHSTPGDLGTIATQPADDNGDVGPFDLYIPATGFGGNHYLTASSPSRGTDTIVIDLGVGAGGTMDPGVDAAPVFIAGSEDRWVLQDLMPEGLGSWVMPVNPTSMSNPHVSKTAVVRSTTAPREGTSHVSEGSVQTVQWTLAGYCPDQTFHQRLLAYAELNRRLYVIDHRRRAWKCAVIGLEITPRKRQTNQDGTTQDWAADYRFVFDLLDQTFVAVEA